MLSSLTNLICAFLSFFLAYSTLKRYQVRNWPERKGFVPIRWTNQKAYATLRQRKKVGGEFGLEIAAEDRVTLLRHVPTQCLEMRILSGIRYKSRGKANHPIVSEIRHSNASNGHQRHLSLKVHLHLSVFNICDDDMYSLLSLQCMSGAKSGRRCELTTTINRGLGLLDRPSLDIRS
jgi:hypothetical protein